MEESFMKDVLEGRKYPTDLILVILLSVIGTVFVLVMPDGNILRLIFGLPMLIFLPGYSLVCVLWPRADSTVSGKGSKEIGLPERAVLGIGLSIVLLPILGFILMKITTLDLLYLIVPMMALTIAFSLLAIFLRNKVPEEERFVLNFLPHAHTDAAEARTDRTFFAVLVGTIVVFSGMAVYMLATPSEGTVYTSFYITDYNGTIADLPKNLTVNETGNVTIGFTNHEAGLTEYTVVACIGNTSQTVIYSDDESTIELNAAHRIGTNVSLAIAGNFEQRYEFSFSAPGSYVIIWDLLVEGEETNYQIHMKVNVV